MTNRTCAAEAPLAPMVGFSHWWVKKCGAPIVEVRQWSHRDINRDEFRWECEKGHPA